MHRRSVSRRVLAVMVISVLVFFAGPLPVRADPGMSSVRIAYQPSLTYGVYVAMAQELGKREGLSLEWIKFTAGPPMLAALSRGDVDVGSMAAVPAVHALAQGIDIKIFLITEDMDRGEALVARRGSGITSFKEQRGKRIATTFGSMPHWGLIRSLKGAGLTEKDLTILDMAPGLWIPAFIKGDIDGVWGWEPWLVKLEHENGVRVGSFKELGIPGLNVMVVRGAFLREHPAAIQKFLRMWDKAVAVPISPEILKAIAAALGLTPDIAREALSNMRRFKPDEQLQGHPGAMGTSQSKAESGLYAQLKEFASFLVAQRKITKAIPDAVLLNAVEAGPIEEYLKRR